MMEIYDGRKLLIWKLLNNPTICKNIPTKFKCINTAKKMFECFRKGGTEDTKSLFKEIVYLFFLFFVNFKSNQITFIVTSLTAVCRGEWKAWPNKNLCQA